VPWLAALAAVLAVLVVLLARVETHARARRAAATEGRRAGRGPAVTAACARAGPVVGAYVAAVAGLLWLTVAGGGLHGPFAIPTGALVLVLTSAAVLRLGRAGAREAT
jgi:hypothetical protein